MSVKGSALAIRISLCTVLVLAVVLLSAAGCGPAATPARIGYGSGESGGARLSLELEPAVPVVTREFPVEGGWLLVDRMGDPLDGLELEVLPNSYDRPVRFDISYHPLAPGSELDGMMVLSPLIVIDNGGAIADIGIILKIPVYMYWRHFPAVWAYDEDTGDLEPLPVIKVEKSTVNVAVRSVDRIIVTSHPYEELEQLVVDTGFVPGRDTWPFPNRGTFFSPRGLSWGMGSAALAYYLEGAGQKGAVPLSQRYDGPGPAGAATPDLWQDDARGLHIVSAVQARYDEARQGRSYDPMYELTRELEGSFSVRSVRFTTDEVTFYSLVTAMAVTSEPQLLNLSVAGGDDGLTLIAYRSEGNTIYVADPNDDPRNPAIHTLVLEYGRFQPYTTREALGDAPAQERTYTEVSFLGQGAMSPGPRVSEVWASAETDAGAPPYRLAALERGANGGPAHEVAVSRGAPTVVQQERVEIVASAADITDVRVRLWGADGAALPGDEIALAPGENRLGVLVEGLAAWVDAAGETQSGWRWLGFDWITVVRE